MVIPDGRKMPLFHRPVIQRALLFSLQDQIFTYYIYFLYTYPTYCFHSVICCCSFFLKGFQAFATCPAAS